jgi:hypothetical protein
MRKRMIYLVCVMGLMLILTACGSAVPAGTFVWIDVPLDGLALPEGPILLEGHASNPGGINSVEVWINGELETTVESLTSEGGLARFHYEWTPPGPGEYIFLAVAFGADGGASEPDSTRVVVGEPAEDLADIAFGDVEIVEAGELDGVLICNATVSFTNAGAAAVEGTFDVSFSVNELPEETLSVEGGLPAGGSGELVFAFPHSGEHAVSAVLDAGESVVESDEGNNVYEGSLRCGETIETEEPATETPEPEVVVQFWAEPETIDAGDCTTVKWHVENVESVIFGNVEQPFDGEYRACLCEGERYTLRVLHTDGTEEKYPVDITVVGTCATPTVEQDLTPPPVPSHTSPSSGSELSCRGSQTLEWQTVDDPSGIAQYQVQVERHSGDNNWQAVSGSTFTGIGGSSKSISVECGWYYRWRVRAIDGEGNASAWSSWWTFTITLT